MRRTAFVVALALACAGFAVPAGSVPLLGRFEVGLTWSPGSPPPGATVTFTATASDNDGAVRIASLCYGDGTPCSTAIEHLSTFEEVSACVFGDNWSRQWTHRYTSPGTYRVTLTVTTRGCPGLGDETKTYAPTVTVT